VRNPFDLATSDVVRGFPSLTDLLNRPAFLTRPVKTRVGGETYVDTDATVTSYRNVHWPIETGTLIRYAHLLPSTSLARTIGTYLAIAVGFKVGDQFEVLGTEYDSRSNELTAGVPFPLLLEETRIPSDTGVVLRVTQYSWPAVYLLESDVETFLGYEGA